MTLLLPIRPGTRGDARRGRAWGPGPHLRTKAAQLCRSWFTPRLPQLGRPSQERRPRGRGFGGGCREGLGAQAGGEV